MRAKSINELSAEDFLKPKSENDIINDYHKLTVIQQIDFLDNSDFAQKIPMENWPLIIRIRNEMDIRPDFFSNFDISDIENISYNTPNVDTSDIGVLFKLTSIFDKKMPFVVIEQIYQEPYVRVYLKNTDNIKSKYFKFNSYQDIWLWMMRIGYKEVLKR